MSKRRKRRNEKRREKRRRGRGEGKRKTTSKGKRKTHNKSDQSLLVPVNEYLGVGMIEEEIPDETKDDEDAVGRGEQRQTREPLGEGADQIGRDVSGGEEEVDQEEESRPVLGRENSRVRQQRVELLVKVGVLQIVSAMGKGKLSYRFIFGASLIRASFRSPSINQYF